MNRRKFLKNSLLSLSGSIFGSALIDALCAPLPKMKITKKSSAVLFFSVDPCGLRTQNEKLPSSEKGKALK